MQVDHILAAAALGTAPADVEPALKRGKKFIPASANSKDNIALVIRGIPAREQQSERHHYRESPELHALTDHLGGVAALSNGEIGRRCRGRHHFSAKSNVGGYMGQHSNYLSSQTSVRTPKNQDPTRDAAAARWSSVQKRYAQTKVLRLKVGPPPSPSAATAK